MVNLDTEKVQGEYIFIITLETGTGKLYFESEKRYKRRIKAYQKAKVLSSHISDLKIVHKEN